MSELLLNLQIGSAWFNYTHSGNALRGVNGVSEQFLKDIDVILEKYPNDYMVTGILGDFVSYIF